MHRQNLHMSKHLLLMLLALLLTACTTKSGAEQQQATPTHMASRPPEDTIPQASHSIEPTHSNTNTSTLQPTQPISPTTNIAQLPTPSPPIGNTPTHTQPHAASEATQPTPMPPDGSSNIQPLRNWGWDNMQGDTTTSLFQSQEELALNTAQRMPYNRVALAHALGHTETISDVARTTPLDVQIGDVQEFWVNNIASHQNYTVTAELRYTGTVVLMYVEQGYDVDQQTLEQAAQSFEQHIYPRTRELFGTEWQPGVDGDTRITILNTKRNNDTAIGYFSSRDSVPKTVNRFSNEREMFYMKTKPGNDSYLSVLAHELQHMIHWNEQRRSATWFNEGCSTLSQDLNGFGSNVFVGTYLANPDTQLTMWSQPSNASLAHYGAANLFIRYIYSHYAHDSGITPLLRDDASNNLHAFATLAQNIHPDITDFGTLFGDWATANVLNNSYVDDGRYAYYPIGVDFEGGLALLPSPVNPKHGTMGKNIGTVQQFGVDYIELPAESQTIHFTGNLTVSLTGATPYEGTYAWWSGRGDNSYATLTRACNLRDLSNATLRFNMWHDIEAEYDYAFVSVSTDGGETWQTLPGNHTTDEDPQGANYGHGITGISGQPDKQTGIGVQATWVEETMDLTPFVGQNIVVRFWQINDEGFHAPGLLIDTISICQEGVPMVCPCKDTVETTTEDWETQGFVRVDGDLRQAWEVRLLRITGYEDLSDLSTLTTTPYNNISVERLAVDGQGKVTASLAEGERGILIIAGTTPHTDTPAQYHVYVE